MKNGINKHVNVNIKLIVNEKKVIEGIIAHAFVIIVNF